MFVEIVRNIVVRFVPTAVTAPMMATAINPAIKPYSIAVAPVSSSANVFTDALAEWISELKDMTYL